jgi:lipoyl(octanoyl) transferase
MRSLQVRRLGLVRYADGLELQRRLVEERKADRIPDTLLLLQHPHVLTIGVNKDGRSHILASPDRLASLGVDVFETGRGGDVTYHGPGQLVGYPIVDLDPDRRDVHRYVRDLEEVMIRVCADYGLEAGRVKGFSGAWIPSTRDARSPLDVARGEPEAVEGSGQAAQEKIGAIGVRISRWITSHGFAFNVTTDVDFFNLIVPCGIADKGVTSLASKLGREPEMARVEDRFVSHFAAVFDRQPQDEGAVSATVISG